jgi:hypothetical protein
VNIMRLDYTTVIRDWPTRCPCGAAAAERYGLCRKCQARAYYSRRKERRHHVRSTARRISRRAARPLVPVLLIAHAMPATRAGNPRSQ